MDARATLNEPHDMREKVLFGASLHDARNNIAAALDHAQYNCLVVVTNFIVAADERLIRLNGFARSA